MAYNDHCNTQKEEITVLSEIIAGGVARKFLDSTLLIHSRLSFTSCVVLSEVLCTAIGNLVACVLRPLLHDQRLEILTLCHLFLNLGDDGGKVGSIL